MPNSTRDFRDSALPWPCGVLGALLFGCALLPLDDDSGFSIIDVVLLVMRDDVIAGLLLSLTLGLPFLFGLVVAVHVATRRTFGTTALRGAAMLLLIEVTLLAMTLANQGEGIAPWALLGVSGSALLGMLGEAMRARVDGIPTAPAFHVRWGAVLIAATFGWLRLQFIDHEPPGLAVVATCLCAALLAGAAARPRVRIDPDALDPRTA